MYWITTQSCSLCWAVAPQWVTGIYPDALYSFYCMALLSLSEKQDIGLTPLNCSLGICQARADRSERVMEDCIRIGIYIYDIRGTILRTVAVFRRTGDM